MSFLNDSKQAQMSFFKLFELSFSTINGTIEQIPDWFELFWAQISVWLKGSLIQYPVFSGGL